MNKFRTKIIFALAILILMVLIGLGILLGQLFKGFYIQTFKDHLEKEANLIGTIISIQDELYNDEFNDKIIEIAKTVDSSISIINPYNKEVIGNEIDQIMIPKLENVIELKKKDIDPFFEISNKTGFLYYVMPIDQNEEFAGYLILTSSVEPLKDINQKIWVLLISSLGVAFIVILMLGAKITNQYARPIEAATQVANELAKGNYNARTYEEQLDETGMLSKSINILARNLQKMTAHQEIQRERLRTLIESMGSGLILIDEKGYINLVNKFFIEFFDVDYENYLNHLYYEAFDHKEVVDLVEEIFLTENQVRKQLHLPIKIERRHFEVYGAPIIGMDEEWKGIVLVFHDITELKKLEKMRKDFVANVSHELKTPITSIKGFSETLLDGPMEEEELREYFLTIILKESDRLQSLINDLLDLSKIEQDGFKLNLQHVNICELLEEILIMLGYKSSEKGIELISSFIDRDIQIEGDPNRLKQIFINLINNAIAYTMKDGKVKVIVQNSKDKVKISIIDTGIGMSTEQIPRIFERFYRIDKARSRNSGGTGLGLAIVKHLVEAHSGEIEVQSKVGEGTTFTVYLWKSIP